MSVETTYQFLLTTLQQTKTNKIQIHNITWNVFHSVKTNWGQQYYYYKDLVMIILYVTVDTFQHGRDLGSYVVKTNNE